MWIDCYDYRLVRWEWLLLIYGYDELDMLDKFLGRFECVNKGFNYGLSVEQLLSLWNRNSLERFINKEIYF